ncbi:MAG TPA: serine hydrolase domain-containing protein [Gemmatimonadales bacterium]|nr:serine hydrolase domain-containing protein [Gemmatimonadales bacterium]
MVILLLALAATPPAQDTLSLTVDSLAAQAMVEHKIPGLTIAVARGGRTVLSRAYGTASVEFNAPVTPQSVFLIASVTKTFTALGILQLAVEGKLDLDAPIERYLGPLPDAWRPITVRHLLTHTAGLKDRFEFTRDGRFYMEYTTGQMRAAAEATPVDTTPGQKFQYSDQGYFLLGQIIEKVSGRTYRQYLTERIFTPAGMTNSTTLNQRELTMGRVPTYVLLQGKLSPAPRAYQFGLVSHFGILTTAEDLARYGIALENGSLLPPAEREVMWSPGKLASGATTRVAHVGMGLGWFLEPFNGRRMVYHEGSTGTALLLAPDDSLVVVVLTNLEALSGSDAIGLARDVASLYDPALDWWNIPPRADPDSAFTRRVETEIRSLTAGTPDSTAYTAEFWKTLRPMLAAQRQGLQSLGLFRGITHLSTDQLGNEKVVSWKVVYADVTLLGKAIETADGRIAHLGLRR